MNVVCAWCGSSIKSDDASRGSERAFVSHGMCEDCFTRLTGDTGHTLGEFLNTLDVTVFLVGSNAEVLASNTDVRPGTLSGDVVECEYSKLPGGCGNTEHCSACALRAAITKTHTSGRSIVDKRSYQIVFRNGRSLRIPISISTVKGKDGVILRIKELA